MTVNPQCEPVQTGAVLLRSIVLLPAAASRAPGGVADAIGWRTLDPAPAHIGGGAYQEDGAEQAVPRRPR